MSGIVFDREEYYSLIEKLEKNRSNAINVHDSLITKKGQIVKFSPDDNIVASKGPVIKTNQGAMAVAGKIPATSQGAGPVRDVRIEIIDVNLDGKKIGEAQVRISRY